jgi:hypothetical protein
VQINVEDRLLARFLVDNMLIPNLLEHGPWLDNSRCRVGHGMLFRVVFNRFWRAIHPANFRRIPAPSSFETVRFIVTYCGY